MPVPTTPTFRTSATYEPAAVRFIDAGIPAPVVQRRGVVAAYSVAMIACAVAVLAVPDVAPPGVALVFLGLALVQPALTMRAKLEHAIVVQQLLELGVMCAVTLVLPSFWPIMTAWLGAGLAWVAFSVPQRIQLPIVTVSLVAAIAVGWSSDATTWPLAIVGLGIIAAACSALGLAVRRELWENESSLVQTLATAGALVFNADLDAGTITTIEGDTEGITGWTSEEWLAIPPRDLIHPDDLAGYWLDAHRLEPGTIVDRIARHRHADGSWVWFRDVSRVSAGPDGGRFLRGFILDITALAEANHQIARQARRDDMTGLGNRLALVEHVERLLARNEPFALLIMDLDRFKDVNDTLGHEAGDELLRVMARRIAETARGAGLLARLGGDEFAVVAEGITTADEITPLLDRLAAITAEPLVVGGVRIAVTSSTGVALSVHAHADRATVMRHADIAMYEAKQRATSSCIFDESLEQTSTMQLTLAAALPQALQHGDIHLHFQPKIDLATGQIVGAEGLARWDHPEFGLLTPYTFLDLLLVSEHAGEFARRTVEQTAEAIRLLRAAGHEIPIAANLTIGALRDIDFGDTVLRILDEHGVAPSELTIELTESDVLIPGTGQPPSIERLTRAGVTMSIDDFGTGHSSLDRLRVLDVGELKIDRAYVNGMASSSLDRQIVDTIIGLAHRLGCRIVAEGVETEDQAAALLELGCPTAQGYLYARPMPFADLVAMADAASAEAAATTVG